MKNLIYDIKVENTKLGQKSNEELEEKINQVKKQSKVESLDKVLVKWFALVQEVAFRKIGLRHFDTQLLAGLFLHQGKIVEMKTGEGKTLASTLPVFISTIFP